MRYYLKYILIIILLFSLFYDNFFIIRETNENQNDSECNYDCPGPFSDDTKLTYSNILCSNDLINESVKICKENKKIGTIRDFPILKECNNYKSEKMLLRDLGKDLKNYKIKYDKLVKCEDSPKLVIEKENESLEKCMGNTDYLCQTQNLLSQSKTIKSKIDTKFNK